MFRLFVAAMLVCFVTMGCTAAEESTEDTAPVVSETEAPPADTTAETEEAPAEEEEAPATTE